MSRRIAELIKSRTIIVCCGAGGVGKTTVSASLAVAGARAGRRVLVLTIDPSKRLAQTLGVGRNHPEPTVLSTDRLEAIGIRPPGSLAAWMIDPKLVAEMAVRKIIKDEAEVQRFLSNRIYQSVTDMIAGMQEYTAMEALHSLVESRKYDLVVLDTPPSRNALNFLEAPSRLTSFLDGSVFKLFLPQDTSALLRAAAKIIHPIMSTVFGEELFGELQAAFGTFGGIFRILGGNAQNMRTYLSRPEVAFMLVTSPFDEALSEAQYFRRRIAQLQLPFRGMILNRSYARTEGMVFPDDSLLPKDAGAAHRQALDKIRAMAEIELARADAHKALLRQLDSESKPDGFAVALPELTAGVDDLAALKTVAEWLVELSID